MLIKREYELKGTSCNLTSYEIKYDDPAILGTAIMEKLGVTMK